jgi:hypothetical protein
MMVYKDEYQRKYEDFIARRRDERIRHERVRELKKEEAVRKEEGIFEEVEKKFIEEEKKHPTLAKFLIFLAFAIPISILLYAFYINYLPFGYSESYVLNIDENGDVSPLSDKIYLEDINGRRILRVSNESSQINLAIVPGVILNNASINVSVEGEGYLGTPLSIDLDEVEWDYEWNLSNGVPEDFRGNANFNEEERCMFFDAYDEQTLYIPDTEDEFESGPMSIYVSWKPSMTSELLGDYQQIIGHFNWDIWQGEKSVQFRIGRLNDSSGPAYSISYPISLDFFEERHEALAIYYPRSDNGYFEFWVDGNFAGRKYIGNETIYENYGNSDLNFGWTSHNYRRNPYYDGCLYEARIKSDFLVDEKKEDVIKANNQKVVIPIISEGKLSKITAKVIQ